MSAKWQSLLVSVLLAVTLGLSACTGAEPEVIEKQVTVEVEKVITQVVKEVVKETIVVEGTPQVVEKEVTRVVEVTPEPTEPPEPEEAKPVVVLETTDPRSLDPAFHMNVTEANVLGHLFNTLTTFDENMNVVPDLATSWEMIDEFTWEFKIREGVIAHNGEAVNAHDVAYTYDRLVELFELDPTSLVVDMKGSRWGFDHAEVLDDYTVRLVFNKPNPQYPIYLMRKPWIVPDEYYSSHTTDETFGNPVGAGPYKFVEWKRGSHLLLEAYEDYYGGAPEIKKVMWRTVPEASARIAELNTGNADIITNVPPDLQGMIDPQYGRLERVTSQRRIYTGFVFYGPNKEFINIKEARQALNYGIDVQAILDNLIGPPAKRVGTFATLQNQDPNTEPYPFDPQKALDLLKEAGYWDRDGDGMIDKPNGEQLVLTMISPHQRFIKDLELGLTMADQIRENLGIEVEVRVLEWSIFQKMIAQTGIESDLFLMSSGSGWTCFGDYDDWGSPTSTWPFHGWKDETWWDMRAEMDLELDPQRYREMCYELGQYLHDEAVLIFMYLQLDQYGVSNRLRDWTPLSNERIWLHTQRLYQ